MADPQQNPVPVPLGSFYSRAIGISSLYVSVPAIAAGGGTGSYVATLTNVRPNDMILLQPPLDMATGTPSVTFSGVVIPGTDQISVLFEKNLAITSSLMYVVSPVMAAGGTGSFAASVPGVNPGDLVTVETPTNWAVGTNSVQFSGFNVTASNVVTLLFSNASGISSPVGTVTTWRYEYISAAASTAQTAKPWKYIWWSLQNRADSDGHNPT